MRFANPLVARFVESAAMPACGACGEVTTCYNQNSELNDWTILKRWEEKTLSKTSNKPSLQ
jgi:hypothetical protein